jgi:beta-galactosidase
MLKNDTVQKLRKYLEQGGTLISEGLPAYFGDHGRAGATQPNDGLDQVFGARESYVEFTPDLLDNLSLEVGGQSIHGRYFLQEYAPSGGQPAGHYANGHIAAVENHYGRGRTLLIGTFPGAGYYLHHSPTAKAFFAGLLNLANVQPQLRTDNAFIQARLHTGVGGSYLWVVNPSRKEATVTVSLAGPAPAFRSAEDIWGKRPVRVGDRKVSLTVAARDAAVIALR